MSSVLTKNEKDETALLKEQMPDAASTQPAIMTAKHPPNKQALDSFGHDEWAKLLKQEKSFFFIFSFP